MSIPLFILYGSATGNSQKIAQDLEAKYKDATPLPFTEIICCQGNDFKRKCSPLWEKEPTATAGTKYGLVLITATTGNGDPPENASRFIRYLKRKTTPDTKPFNHVVFGVLGLGDTNYDKFCETAKVADRCLEKCGGTRAKTLGCADEGTGLEDVVEGWVEDIIPILSKACIGSPNEGSGKLTDSLTDEEKKDDNEKSSFPGARPIISNMVGSRPNVGNIRSLGSRPNVTAIRSRLNTSQQNGSSALPGSVTQGEAAMTVTNDGKKKTNTEDATALSSPTPLCILYGSATGNAEQIAKDLTTRCKKVISESESCYFSEVKCCELDKYKKECLSYWEDESSLNHDIGQKHGLLIISSTTGNGEAPENASRFVRYIKRKSTAPTMPFRNVAFAVLGLGDTNYDQFCNTAIIIDKKLKELGGVRVKDLACADEGTGLEETVDPWVNTIFDMLIKRCQGIVHTSRKDPMSDCDQNLSVTDDKPDDTVAITDTDPMTESTPLNVSTLRASESILSEDASCFGAPLIRKLIASLSSKDDASIPIVENSSIPAVTSTLSSYQVLHGNEESEPSLLESHRIETMTISTASSSGINYSVVRPFNSKIMSARYLTNTNTDCAQVISDALNSTQPNDDSAVDGAFIRATKEIKKSFPLDEEEGNEINHEVYSKNGKRVIEVTLSLPDDSSLEYSPGDSIGIVPSNTPEATKFVLDMLSKAHNIAPSMMIKVDSSEAMPVKQAICDRIDLCSPIKNKRILAHLSSFATNNNEKLALRFLASCEPLGEEIFRKYVEEQRRNVIDILQEFPSCQSVTLSGLLAVIPSIAPRYYSICSSPLGKKTDDSPTLNIAFSVVDYKTPALLAGNKKRRVMGLVTSHLETMCAPFLNKSHTHLNQSSFARPIRIFPKPSVDFHLPSQLTTPLILIGPGTGIAPFMGFLAHRKAEISARDATLAAKVASEGTWRGNYTFEKNDLSISTGDASGLSIGSDYRSNQTIGEVDVYFGCRHSNHDWLFKTEMEILKKEGIVSQLNVSFSRENNGHKVYVQDKMRNNADRIARMITKDDAVVYICGDGNEMAKDVKKTLVDILAQYKFNTYSESDSSQTKANEYYEQMKADKRLLMDIWS